MAETKSGSKNKQIVKLLENYKSGNMTDIKSGSIVQLENVAKVSIWRYSKKISGKTAENKSGNIQLCSNNSKLEILLKYRNESME